MHARINEPLSLERGRFLRILGVHDPLSALIARDNGFDALWVSSLGVSAACLGLPDVGVLTLNEMLRTACQIRSVAGLPVIVDADTGYGDSLNVLRLVREAGCIGVDALCIEDAAFPKRNSFVDRHLRALADVGTMCERLQIACETRAQDGPRIIARTEVLTQGGDVGTALERAHAYRAAGADAIIVHSTHSQGSDVFEFSRRWRESCPLLAIPTAFPGIAIQRFQDEGISGVVIANQLLRAAHRAMSEIAGALASAPAIDVVENRISTVAQIHATVGMPGYLEAQQRVAAQWHTPSPVEGESTPHGCAGGSQEPRPSSPAGAPHDEHASERL
jgi:phosphoenolpyruvate phosphomutase